MRVSCAALFHGGDAAKSTRCACNKAFAWQQSDLLWAWLTASRAMDDIKAYAISWLDWAANYARNDPQDFLSRRKLLVDCARIS